MEFHKIYRKNLWGMAIFSKKIVEKGGFGGDWRGKF